MRMLFPAAVASFVALSSPADATAFCEVKQTSDGFVALRATPSPAGKLIRKINSGESVQIDRTRRAQGNWMSVYYRGPDRSLNEQGWVNQRLIGDLCG
jgi:uncharacterized protein YraI